MTLLLAITVCSYFLGSIPFGYLLIRAFSGQDIRETGSGNIGATNVARSSPWLGIVTLLLDAAKGSAAVAITVVLCRAWSSGYSLPLSQIATRAAFAGLVAILGHMFPIWLNFKGGKGVATSLGAFAMIAPKAILVALAAFVLVLAAFRYVSLSSMSAVVVFPLTVWLLGKYEGEPLILGLVGVAAVTIVMKHHQNIRRLLSGTEPRMQWGKA